MSFHDQAQAVVDRMNRLQHWGYCFVEPQDSIQGALIAAHNQHVAACEGCRWVVRAGRAVAQACTESLALAKRINDSLSATTSKISCAAEVPYGLSEAQEAAWLAREDGMSDMRGSVAP